MSTRPDIPSGRYWAVIPAAGSGTRMGGDRPKQYFEVLGRPLIEHAAAPFLRASWIEGVVVVIAADDRRFAKLDLASNPRVHTAQGGARRAESVHAGLECVASQCGGDAGPVFVLVHDAARPGLRTQELECLRDLASDKDGGLLAVPVADTLKREAAGRVATTVERDGLWRAQTPQLFEMHTLAQALQRAIRSNAEVTDEASAMEAAGFRPRLVPGHAGNLKVTTVDDLPLAEFWLAGNGNAA